jgi:hypothetical protein
MQLPLRNRRQVLTAAVISVGVLLVIDCLRWQGMPRTDAEDVWAWQLWGMGWFIIGAAASSPFVRPIVAAMIGIAAPFLMFAVGVGVYYGLILAGAAQLL